MRPHLLRLLARRLPESTRVHNAYGLSEAPYILTGDIDVRDSSSANRFAWPDPARHIRFDRDPNAGDGQTPVALRLRLGGPLLFSGYATSPDHLHLPRDEDGLFDVGDAFAGDERGVRYVGRRDRRLNWWGHRIEPEEIERALCADGRIAAARLTIDAVGELVCEVESDLALNVLEAEVLARICETSMARFSGWIKVVMAVEGFNEFRRNTFGRGQ